MDFLSTVLLLVVLLAMVAVAFFVVETKKRGFCQASGDSFEH